MTKLIEVLDAQLNKDQALNIIDIINIYKAACFDLNIEPSLDQLENILDQIK